MGSFSEARAKSLMAAGKYDELLSYCLTFPDDAASMVYLAICYHNGYGTQKDYSKSFYYDSESARLGNADGIAGLAYDHYYGYGTEVDEAKALLLVKEAVEKGSVKAMRFLAYFYGDGKGVAQNSRQAVEWFQKAADLGDAISMRRLGLNYENGVGVEKDCAKAIQWYRKAAALGDATAMRYLGLNYEDGVGVEKDEAEAIQWYRKAAELGDTGSMILLGVLYQNGTGVETDEAKAMEWYRKAAALGDATAMRCLGLNYENGIGVEKDEAKATEWYRKAAELGNARAMCCLGVCYQNGTGVEKDDAKATEWYRKAAELGDARAMRCLGVCYQNGTGVGKDEAEAIQWYRKAAALGDATAMRYLGVNYEAGTGVEKDHAKAIQWFRKSAELGNAMAMLFLGIIYQNGSGVEKDEAKAIQWFRSAAELGNTMAMVCLGVNYEAGIGVEKGEAKATEWYRKAAELGDAMAMRYLGISYEIGRGVEKDEAKALEWYRKAAALGITDSLADLYLLGKGVSKNLAKAYELYAASDTPYADQIIGEFSYYGCCVSKDYPKAVSIFKKGADLGDSRAEVYLGLCYLHGRGVKRDVRLALQCFETASQSKDWYGEHARGFAALTTLAFPALFAERRAEALLALEDLNAWENSFWSGLYEAFHLILPGKAYRLLKLAESRLARAYYRKISGPIFLAGQFVIVMASFLPAYIKSTIGGTGATRQDVHIAIDALRGELSQTQEELAYQRKILEAKDETIARLTEEIGFYRNIMQGGIQSIGKQVKEINIRTQSIEAGVTSLLDFLQNDLVQVLKADKSDLQKSIAHITDETTIEQMTSQCLNSITSYINDRVSASDDLVEEERKHLVALFGDGWDKLLRTSQISLISAGVLWKSCANIQDHVDFDFSGICISATSALEAEVKRYFFEGFRDHLKKTYGAPSDRDWEQTFSIWPDELLSISKIDFERAMALYEKDPKANKRPYINLKNIERDVTLGSLPYLFVTSMPNSLKSNQAEKARRLSVFRGRLNEYLLTITRPSEGEPLSLFLDGPGDSNFVKRCDDVRKRYRNPSAHTDIVTREAALDCYQEVVGKVDAYRHTTEVTSLLMELVSKVK